MNKNAVGGKSMKQIIIPSFLHDVFGKKQSLVSIFTILLFGGLLTAILYWMYPEMTSNLPVWRSALSLLLIFDIFAGCIANFTLSTSNYYPTFSRRINWGFTKHGDRIFYRGMGVYHNRGLYRELA